MNTFSKTLALVAMAAVLTGCGGGDSGDTAAAHPGDHDVASLAVDPLDDAAANAAPSEAVMPPGDPFDAEFPAALQLPNAVL